VAERLYLIVDMDVKYRENPEHQYWPNQMWQVREKNMYWPTLSRISRVVLSVILYHQGSFHHIYVNIIVVK
jgi:hypothetical protein